MKKEISRGCPICNFSTHKVCVEKKNLSTTFLKISKNIDDREIKIKNILRHNKNGSRNLRDDLRRVFKAYPCSRHFGILLKKTIKTILKNLE
jgi:hypothetical protein